MRNKNSLLLVLGSLSLLTLLVFILSLSLGDQQFNLSDTVRYLLGSGDSSLQFIMGEIRLPRLLVCLLAGASLGMSGVLLQTFSRNPLADSGTLGINAGAGVVITLAISQLEVTDPLYIRYLPFVAMLGGMLTVAVTYLISHQKGQAIRPVKIIISGVTLSAILSSSMIAITGRVNQNKLTYVVSWLAGKITGNNWESLAIAGPVLLLLWFLTYQRAYQLNILSLNDETALGLGLHLKRERLLLLLLASALVAFSLSLAGNIAFIGMLASHISKRFLPNDHRLLFPAAMLLGALIMTIADTITRAFLIGTAIPTGIIISIIGAPYFLYLLWQTQK
ncbi:FecCD family ABC transporter permease [Streptococcus panodentis]|uniref:Ferrichrome ABC transporter permease n=1 Tax=Streptococcus panodentis TaxID=1581472 RepID=A0ABS5AWP7_9STRE|nr:MULTISPECIES: iron ABC transporter permease [Streptococcus]KXT84616.1 iron ABC superfamily ATP binding cassette transporter, membrane protein [Streptococcus sp. DD11]MBP2620925.1 ferrichrome ABC transporter permease [Streptococcus panodentis]